MKNIFETIADLIKAGEPLALATIIRTKGSTPRKVGTKVVILKEGNIFGTMGEGDLEKKVIEEAIDAIRKGEPGTISFTLDIEKGKLDMMCGGELDAFKPPQI